MPETILPRTIEDDMRESYLDYAMSVIVGRAIPDARDGLKPVHRRILFAMHEMGNTFDKPHKKSARAIGECLGKFHPHGDVAIYDALIRMAQDFSLRYPLIHGQGNVGSQDGDSPASMRYCVTGNTLIVTEKGMERIGELSDKEDIERMVLSIDNKVNTASKWFDSGTHRTKTINTRRGFHLTGTLNHPILVWSKNAKGKPRLNWKLIQNLKNGDYAVISRAPLLFPKEEPKLKKYHPPLKSNRERKMLPKTMGPDLALLLGMIVAEGSVCKHNIGFCNSDDEFLQIFKKIFKRVFPDCRLHEYVRKPVGYTKKPYTSLEIHSHHVVEFFKNLGLEPVRAKKKEIPKIIWQASKESLAAFIRGYAEGDGSVYKYGGPEITFTSVSAELLKELQILLLRFGINSSYNYQPSRKTYKILIRGVDSHSLFKDQIDFLTKRKIKKLEEICELNKDMRIFSQTDYVPYVAEYMRNNGYKGKSREWLIKHNIDRVPKIKRYQKTLFEILNEADKTLYADILSNNYIFDKITSITDSGFQKVYSIRVDSNCHSFVSNGFISHNTEVRLAKIADDILADLEKETVDWMDNFDGTLKEPIVMPSRIPNLLINGTSGIAVGMATNIPPHNLTEIIDGTIAVIEGADESKLLTIVNGPDFPTGGEILGRSGIMQAYKTGRGIIRIRGKAHVDAKRNAIVITEIPYQVTKTAIIEAIAEAVKNKHIEGISGVHDRSDKDGIEVLVDLKKSAIGEVVLNQIYAHTPLEGTFGIINLVLVGKQPKVLGIYPLISEFVEFRKEVVRKRCLFELKQAEERAHILEGLRTALENIDAIVVFLKKTKDIAEARAGLMKEYSLSEKQANAILDMKISRLVALERQKIEDEYAGFVKTIAWLKDVLADINKILKIIKNELLEVKAKYGDARRTAILEAEGEVTDESLIPNEQVVIPISGRGYVKRVGLDEYRTQHRGGKGVMGAETKEEDFVQDVIVVRNHNYILFFTDKGRVFWLKAYQIPEAGRYASGKSLVNLLDLKEEKVSSWIPVPEFKPDEYLVMVTKNGIVKRTSLDDFSHPRKNGIIAITLRDADQLVEVIKTDGKEELLVATKQGQAIRFDENDAREIGRAGMGVIGIRLKDKDDAVVGVASCKKYPSVLTITENGYGKRTATDEYRLQGRGGSGVINIKTEGRNGSVVSVRGVVDTDEVIVISSKGQTIRSPVTDISVIGRNTQGVRIIRLQEEEGEKVASFAVVPKEEQKPEGETRMEGNP